MLHVIEITKWLMYSVSLVHGANNTSKQSKIICAVNKVCFEYSTSLNLLDIQYYFHD